jgi:hypothetical protein
MDVGPKVEAGFDLALTELIEEGRHLFVMEVGSAAGVDLVKDLPHRLATEQEIAAAERVVDRTKGAEMLVPVSVSCSWNRRISSAMAVSGERFKYAANRLQPPMASLRARVELARAHLLDHALAQRADGIGTHRELS